MFAGNWKCDCSIAIANKLPVSNQCTRLDNVGAHTSGKQRAHAILACSYSAVRVFATMEVEHLLSSCMQVSLMCPRRLGQQQTADTSQVSAAGTLLKSQQQTADTSQASAAGARVCRRPHVETLNIRGFQWGVGERSCSLLIDLTAAHCILQLH